MFKYLILVVVLTITQIASAQLGQPYKSGETLYQQYLENNPTATIWKFVAVPFSYKNLTGEHVKISYRTSPNFTTDKPTVIFFNGGPGASAEGYNFSHAIPEINFVYFNQRGSLFSRPDLETEFMNPDYYSSENTARDALEIMKALGLSIVSVYGHSYGTVPATIFAHLFPQYTRSVLLEGVIFSGEPSLWNLPHRTKVLRQFFSELPVSTQALILKYSEASNPGWFANLAKYFAYSPDFEKRLSSFLITLLGVDNPALTESEIRNTLTAFKDRPTMLTDDPRNSGVMFTMITCKELSGFSPESSFETEFVNGVLQTKNRDYQNCSQLKIDQAAEKTYYSVDYPINKPVYYFQGVNDGATSADFAIKHYKQTAQSSATLLLSKNAGHIPLHESLAASPEELVKIDSVQLLGVQNIFKAAVLAAPIERTYVDQINTANISRWVMTFKP